MTKYLEEIKSLSNSLSAAGHFIKEMNFVFYTFGDLGPDFEQFVIFVTSQTDIITIDDLHYLFLT